MFIINSLFLVNGTRPTFSNSESNKNTEMMLYVHCPLVLQLFVHGLWKMLLILIIFIQFKVLCATIGKLHSPFLVCNCLYSRTAIQNLIPLVAFPYPKSQCTINFFNPLGTICNTMRFLSIIVR